MSEIAQILNELHDPQISSASISLARAELATLQSHSDMLGEVVEALDKHIPKRHCSNCTSYGIAMQTNSYCSLPAERIYLESIDGDGISKLRKDGYIIENWEDIILCPQHEYNSRYTSDLQTLARARALLEDKNG